MKQQFTVVGARYFNDSVEGQSFDFTKIRVQMPVPESAANQVGYDVIDIPFGKSDNFAKLKDLRFPLQAELDVELTTKGLECKGFNPLQASAQPKVVNG